MKLTLATSGICGSGGHCGTCRKLDAGRAFRASLGRYVELPPGGVDFPCPYGRPWGFAPNGTLPRMPPRPARGEGQGPALWGKLHRFALRRPTEARARKWLKGFERRISCGECRKHWGAVLKATPPDFADLFAWSVAAHDAVNAMLGKPAFGVEAARRVYAAGGE